MFEDIENGIKLETVISYEFCEGNLYLLNESLGQYARKIKRNKKLNKKIQDFNQKNLESLGIKKEDLDANRTTSLELEDKL